MKRLSKWIAESGLLSRRQAEVYIQDGRVTVNGEIITQMGVCLPTSAGIRVDGKLLHQPTRSRLWLYYKPVGLVTTHWDPEGRATVFEEVSDYLGVAHILSVGRLDQYSEGLLLITNNGTLARELELPKNGYQRVYEVHIGGPLHDQFFEDLPQGAYIDGLHYRPIHIDIIDRPNYVYILHLTLSEGKNREIRQLIDYYGGYVKRLIRIQYGPYQLGSLKPRQIREVKIVH